MERRLEIRFRDERLRMLCEQRRRMERKLGAVVARKLRARLSDLEDASCVAKLVAVRPHPLRGNRAGQFALELHGGVRLVFEPLDQPPPEKVGGGIDWSAVDAVRIAYIGDYHD